MHYSLAIFVEIILFPPRIRNGRGCESILVSAQDTQCVVAYHGHCLYLEVVATLSQVLLVVDEFCESNDIWQIYTDVDQLT